MLKSGTVEALYSNIRESPLYNLPIVQVLALKKIDGKTDKSVRYHVTISDGKFYMKGICSSQVSKEIEGMPINTIIKIIDFVILEKNGTCFIYVKNCEKLKQSERIGTPKNISNEKDSFVDQDSSKGKIDHKENEFNTENESKRLQVDKSHPSHNNQNKSQIDRQRMQNHELFHENKEFTPIAALNPFQNKWFIKGTVQKKSDLRDFKKGDGKLYSFELVDKSGSIKVVAFNEAAHLFFDMTKEGIVMELSKSTVKMSNRQFNNCTSDYEIHLDKLSYLNPIDEKPIETKYEFTKLSNISNSMDKSNLTVVGVVHEAYPISTIITKTTQKEAKKRDVIIVDETSSMKLTLWGENAELDFDDNPTILITDLRISEYNQQFNLNCTFNSTIRVDPEIEEAFAVKGWYDSNKSAVQIQRPKKQIEYSFLEEVDNFGTCIVTLLFIKEDNLFYTACTDNCNKKVTLTEDGYHCERCNQTKENCTYRYLTTFHISDFTQQIWLQVFDDFCTSLFGMTAEDLKKMGEENSQELQTFLKSFLNKEYVVKLRRLEEVYNGEMKIKYRGMNIQKVNYQDECVRMMKLMNIN